MDKIKQALRGIASALIQVYRYSLSPAVGPCCRFYPSCSIYTQQAIAHYGLLKGLWKGLCRLGRCHPGFAGGYDPVIPEKDDARCPAPTSDSLSQRS